MFDNTIIMDSVDYDALKAKVLLDDLKAATGLTPGKVHVMTARTVEVNTATPGLRLRKTVPTHKVCDFTLRGRDRYTVWNALVQGILFHCTIQGISLTDAELAVIKAAAAKNVSSLPRFVDVKAAESKVVKSDKDQVAKFKHDFPQVTLVLHVPVDGTDTLLIDQPNSWMAAKKTVNALGRYNIRAFSPVALIPGSP